jgi:ABC-type transporter Mla maintaining outer membrane lipid asymmetry ATPase subunit MlaF
VSEAVQDSSTAVNYFEFRDVCKAFDGRPVLKDVSFTVKRGETCVIMGAAAEIGVVEAHGF